MKLVRDKLFINGRQFIPNTTDNQSHNPQNNSNANNDSQSRYGPSRRIDRRNEDRQQQINLQKQGYTTMATTASSNPATFELASTEK